jgi:hypothetical protein
MTTQKHIFMKNLGMTIMISVISSVLAVLVYDRIKGEPTEIVRIHEGGRYGKFTGGAAYVSNDFDRSLYFTAAPTNFYRCG